MTLHPELSALLQGLAFPSGLLLGGLVLADSRPAVAARPLPRTAVALGGALGIAGPDQRAAESGYDLSGPADRVVANWPLSPRRITWSPATATYWRSPAGLPAPSSRRTNTPLHPARSRSSPCDPHSFPAKEIHSPQMMRRVG